MASRTLSEVSHALNLLTIVPAPIDRDSTVRLKDAVKWFPLVGAALGTVLMALGGVAITTARYIPIAPSNDTGSLGLSVAVGLALVVSSFVLTRGMHWDGLADVSDAWWGGYTVERRLEIMGDSAIGTFGGFALVTAFASGVLGMIGVLDSLWALPLICAIGRMSAVFGAQLGVPAKADGLGAQTLTGLVPSAPNRTRSFGHGPTWIVAVVTVLVVGFACISLSGSASTDAPFGTIGVVVALVASLLSAAVVPHMISMRMGGVTGDVLGASILLTELFSLACFAVLA